jgi:outer membrane lipoprotein-sorting protein
LKKNYLVAGLCLLIALLCLVSACGSSGKSPAAATTTSHTTTSQPTTTTTAKATTTTPVSGVSVSDLFSMGASAKTVKFDLTLTISGQDPVTMTIYKKGNKMRQELTVSGTQAANIIDGDAQKMYTLIPSLKMFTESAFSASMLTSVTWDNAADFLKYNPGITGTETIDGKSCTVVQWEGGGASVKYWVWTDTGLPLKIQSNAGGQISTMEYSNIDLSDIADSMFQVPDNYTTM